ncbi:MAG: major capsid protein [Microviridae sp.]|nr:MAG: major capsid protein [Microviridae sp.]
MKNIFADIGLRKPRKSSFDLSHARKMSFWPGMLIPIFLHDTMPGDKFSMSSSALVRMMPMLAPIMHLVDCCSYSFFVPMRLCMKHSKFEVFITGGKNGDGKDAQGNTVEIPYFVVNNGGSSVPPYSFDISKIGKGTLGDYLGIGMSDIYGTMGSGSQRINAMPFLAFWRIWCEYFRDQNLHPDYVSLYPDVFDAEGDITHALELAQTDGTNPFDWFHVPNVCWEKDLLTSALPFAQRGQPVETPLSGTATVTYKTNTEQIVQSDGNPLTVGGDVEVVPGTGGAGFLRNKTGPEGLSVENIQDVELTSGGFTINALRLAARLQEWLERMARGGARYVEQCLSMWGVVSSDARLQRSEYLAGGKMPVSISEVLQTGEEGVTAQGNMSGHGVAAGNVTHWSKYFEEHGYIVSVFFMRPRTAYQNGIPRLFTQRFDKLDWPWWQFANLGEQEVLNREVYFNLDNNDSGTFGYQQRLHEYKYIPNTVHGEMRDSLDFWHWGRKFAELPALNPNFVTCSPDDRIFALQDDLFDSIVAIVNNRIEAIRPLPYRGEPTL